MGKSISLRVGAIVVAFTLLFSLTLNAGAVSSTKNTPYGTMRAEMSAGYDNLHGVDVVTWLETSIDSSVTMRKITYGIEVEYRDTGETIKTASFSYPNTNDTGLVQWEYALDQSKLDREIAVYSSHQVLYTDAYVIYLVDTLPSYWDVVG